MVALSADGDSGFARLVASSGYTLLRTADARSSQGHLRVYSRPATGGEQTIVSNTGGSSTVRLAAIEVAGIVDVSSEVDNGSAYVSTFTADTLTPSTTGVAGVILAFFDAYYQSYNVGSLSPNGSLVEDAENYDAGRLVAWWGHQEVASLGSSYAPSVASTVTPANNDAANTWGSVAVLLTAGPLVANFSGTPLSGNRPLGVQFTDLSDGGSDGTVDTWEWDFGDSTVSTEQHPYHIYAQPGTYTVTLIARVGTTASDSETKVAYVTASVPTAATPTATPDAEFWVDWDNDGFTTGGTSDYELARMLPEGNVADDDISAYVQEVRWQRGGQQDLIGGQSVGSLVAILKNTDGRFTPDNTASPLYGKLDVGRRVWLGALLDTAVYKGLWAGYIKEIVPVPRVKQVQLICHDPFGVWQEARVRASFSTTRSAAEWRRVILTELGVPASQVALAPEPYQLDVSGADTKNGVSLLDELNAQTALHHLIIPADDKDDFYTYRTIGRNENLGLDTPPVTLTEDDITGMAGYRRSFQTIINYQQVTPHQRKFPDEATLVWSYQSIPFAVSAAAERLIKANFSNWVLAPFVKLITDTLGEVTVYADAPTTEVGISHYGQSAELRMTGVGLVSKLEVWGQLADEPGESVEFAEDLASQTRYEAVREGTPVDATLSGSAAQAQAVAQSIVYRGGTPKTRPQVTFRNRFDKTMVYDHGSVVAQSLAELDISSRRYEIVGVDGAITEGGKWWDIGWTYLETPFQATLGLFKLNVSTLNGSDILGF
jgi:PKD repeat protein